MAKTKTKKISIEKIHKDYKRSGRFNSKWKKEAKEDIEFVLGDQWDEKVKNDVEKQGRPALTLNIIQPIVRLVSGYQRDSRSSIKAYPEGGEDQLTSEVVTKLLKNVIKNSDAEDVVSEAFETCLTARGKAFIEPYLDYTYDLLNGKMMFNVLDGWQIRFDSNSVKYDLSDARFVIKEKPLTEDEIIELHPEKERKIEEGINLPMEDDAGVSKEDNFLESGQDYPGTDEMDKDLPITPEEKTFKYIIYYYKKYVDQHLAVDVNKNLAQMFKTEKKALRFLKVGSKGDLTKGQKIIPKKIPEIWQVASVGQVILDDSRAESYPAWRGYPIIPLFGWYSSVGKRVLKREDLAYQGIASSLKDPQTEKNKRRSQSLHIVNAVANRGWLTEEGSWVDINKVAQFGSKAGVNLEYKKGRPMPKQLEPGNIPSAHIYFEEKSEEDIKIISGVNADMLSVEDKNTSGRAIALRQRQGVRILKPLLDNVVKSQKLLVKYIVSQLSEIYTVDKALRVLGSEFITKHFRKSEQDPIELVMGKAGEFVEGILNDGELVNYDISIGQGLESPTERYAQYNSLLELAEKGLPIPPQILVEYSDIPESAKQEILSAVQSAPQPEPGPGQNRPRRKSKGVPQ